jgi:hypothetical protein
MKRTAIVVALVACSGGSAEPVAPEPEPTAAATAEPKTATSLRDQLVEPHERAVEECFGGFGKGVPYSAELTVESGAVTAAAVEPLDAAATAMPRDCVAKHFVGKPLSPSGTNVRARFGVKDGSCPAHGCAANDLPCVFRHDIACSIVVE